MTAGPRLFFEDGGAVYISRFDLGIFRIGTNSLSGLDPLPNCFSDPDWCTYGNFAEMDLASGKLDGLSPGSSGGDQEMIQAEAGPAKDRRMAVRPARGDGGGGFNHEYLNFAITDEKLGPSSQPGVKLAICVTYYDDPNLTGASFRPEVYSGDRGGNEGLLFTQSSVAVQLEGTDTWRDAYFEITDVKFTGVNQGPQAAARFIVSDKVFFSRVRYGAIRGCDVSGTNPLAACKPVTEPIIKFVRNTNGSLKFSWAGAVTDFVLEQTSNLSKLDWTGVTLTPVVEDTQVTATVAPTVSTFYRLRKR